VRSVQDDEGRDRSAAGPDTDDGGALRAGASSTPPSSAPPAGEAEQVEADLEGLLKERDDYLELAKRTKADFENFRKRMAGEVQAAAARGKVEATKEILSVVDHFELALQHSGIDSVAALANKEGNAIEAGWAMTFRDLHDALNRIGVEAIDPRGEKFDPAAHEALSTQPVDGAEHGTVVEVMQKGYRLDGQLIRPARVVVAE